VLIRAPQFAPANGSFGHQTRGGLWGSQFVSEISRLGSEMGVFSEAMKILSLMAGLFFAASIALGDDQQTITMDDGTKLTLLGTTFGSHHMAPGYENLRTANWINTAPNTTVVWIKEEPEPSKQPIELLVSDRANTGCVSTESSTGSHIEDGVSLQSFVLSAFPRWDKETILLVRPYRGTVVKGEFVLTNPVTGMFAQWTPKPLPDTESDGNLEVTLTKLVAGATTPSWAGGSLVPTNDPANQCVHLNFDFRQNGQSTTNWDAWPVQTTDASGNWSRGLIYAYPTNGVRRIWGWMKAGYYIPPPEHYGMDGYYFQPGLWPNQPWKVRLEFIQRSGFSDDEIVTFTNLPVKTGSQQDWDDEWSAWDIGKTNFPFTITPATANGVHLKLLPPLLVPDKNSPGQKRVSVIIGADPDFNPKGMNLTVVSATDDQGRDLWHPFGSSWAGHYDLDFPNVRDDIKSLNLTLALHKSRFVEFTVKPEKAGNDTTAR
jgi:hypothetical protein